MSRPARPLAAFRAERLRAAAAEAFGTSGLDGASLNQILEQGGMGKGSFYHHFADKAALHDWVAAGLAATLLDAVRPPRLDTLTNANFRPELADLLDRAGSTAITHPELSDLGRMFHHSAAVDPERTIAKVRRAVTAWVTDALRTGRALGVIRRDLPVDLLTAWTIASLTVIDQWTLSETTPTTARRSAAETALQALWHLLTAEENSSAGVRHRVQAKDR